MMTAGVQEKYFIKLKCEMTGPGRIRLGFPTEQAFLRHLNSSLDRSNSIWNLKELTKAVVPLMWQMLSFPPLRRATLSMSCSWGIHCSIML